MFKLSIGEYVAPEKLENVFVQSQWVGQNFVYGDSFKSVVVAVVVPDFEVLVPWAQNKGKPTDHKALCADKEIIKMVLDDMAAKGSLAPLSASHNSSLFRSCQWTEAV